MILLKQSLSAYIRNCKLSRGLRCCLSAPRHHSRLRHLFPQWLTPHSLWAMRSASGNSLTQGSDGFVRGHKGSIYCRHSWPSWGALAAPELPQRSPKDPGTALPVPTLPLPILLAWLPSLVFQRVLLSGLPAYRSLPWILFPGKQGKLLKWKSGRRQEENKQTNKQQKKTRQQNILQ